MPANPPAPEPKQKPPHPELGLLHQAGPKAVRKLSEAGLDVPDHWAVLADHPRRGLVIAIHPESGEGRPVAPRPKERVARAVVVWTSEGAFLSALPADASKN